MFYLEEGHCGSAPYSTVLDLSLLGQVVSVLDGGRHTLHGEEGGKVGRVGGNYDEGEEPPDTTHNTSGYGSRRHFAACNRVVGVTTITGTGSLDCFSI